MTLIFFFNYLSSCQLDCFLSLNISFAYQNLLMLICYFMSNFSSYSVKQMKCSEYDTFFSKFLDCFVLKFYAILFPV